MSFSFEIIDSIVPAALAGLGAIVSGELVTRKFKKDNQESKYLTEKIAEFVTTDENDKKNIEWDFIEELVNTYHKQALSQASIQFIFSIAAATSGFLLIIYMMITRTNSSELELVLKSLPGVAISSVAGLFFKQAGETRQRATELYDRLRNDKKIKEAISLVDTIENDNIKSLIKAQIALNISGLECNPINISDLFNCIAKKTE